MDYMGVRRKRCNKDRDHLIDSYGGEKLEKPKRPRIPEKVQRELWGRSAGRCEFHGCNKILYKDETTQKQKNAAQIAHIISWIATGPRGNVTESPKLATDISNLMLTCPAHNSLIDSLDYVEKYPVELLRKYKKEHEDRVARLTGLGENYSVRVIELVSKIQNHTPQITEEEELEAILPYYPKENPIRIDLCNVENIDEAKRIIDQKVDLYISQGEKERYTTFIMAKIPYAVYLGYALGNKLQVSTHQFFRDTQNWKWKERSEGFFSIIQSNVSGEEKDIDLLVEVSGIIQDNLVPDFPIYRIQASAPGFMFLQTEEQVIEFRMKYREMLDLIRNKHGEDVTIHLLLAAPNPITFEVGRTLMKNIDPTIVLYDKTAEKLQYEQIMILHKRIRENNS